MIEKLDPETIAALLEGKLSVRERARLIEQIGRSPEQVELLAEAATVMREITSEPAIGIERQPSPWFRTRAVRVALPIAALLAGIIAIPMWLQSRVPEPLALLDGIVIGKDAGQPRLAAGWDQPGWPAMRGQLVERPLNQIEFKAGVRVVDLMVAWQLEDTARAANLNGELRVLLNQIPGSAPIVIELSDAARFRTSPNPPELNAFRRPIQHFFSGSAWFALGAWVEQARLAAMVNRQDFFDRTAVRMFERTRLDLDLGSAPGLRQALDNLNGRLNADVTGEAMPEILRMLDAIVVLSTS